jgi:hypothetical protein
MRHTGMVRIYTEDYVDRTDHNKGKQPYNTPKLERYGDVRDLTMSVATMGANDGGTVSPHVRTH